MIRESADVIVIGAGAAGLTAARALAHSGRSVLLLEARNRLGGRIHTVPDSQGQPIELGAEFIHGRPSEIFRTIITAGLDVREANGMQWVQDSRGLEPHPGFFARIRAVLDAIPAAPPDRSFASYLDDFYPLEDESRLWSLEYVEGFHGAIAEKISIHSLRRGLRAEDMISGHRSFRFMHGYKVLLDAIQRDTSADKVSLRLENTVSAVRWGGEGRVQVEAATPEGDAIYEAKAAVVTLPLGVMQAPLNAAGAVHFDPPLTEKAGPLGLLFMGQAIRISLVFRSCWWEQIERGVRNLGILHSHEEWFPTWWTPQNAGAVLTGWAASRRGERLSGRPAEYVLERALDSLAALFPLERRRIAAELLSWHTHDWQNDPFSRGSYSYVGVDGEGAQKVLAAPLGNKLFFAGEATASDGHHATVHGAIGSGERAAREVLSTLDVGHRKR
ncbi:MAG: NAD(P)/FAD-dependent oxidoreductase [Acidobacteriota bacterium]|nr:NAD(P)/FAD-dependent oxidoreductase [Acidobacteriota bacterium]